MSRSTPVSVFACLIPALGAPLAAQTPGDSLRYTLPAPPGVAYQISLASWTTESNGAGVASMETSATLNATFEAGPAGLVVTASLEDFAIRHSGLTGTRTWEQAVTGDIVLVVDSRGRVDVVSTPDADPITESMIIAMAHGMFPRLPDDAVRPDDKWVDTTSWEYETEGLELASSSVYTYTLFGDAVVDGRTLTGILISGVTKSRAAMEFFVETLESSDTGYLLWDPKRNLLHSIEIEGHSTGTVSMGMGMGEFVTTGSATSRYSTKN